jgi:hypothetical protein
VSVRFNATADDLRRSSLGFGAQTAWTFTCWGQIVTDRNNFSTLWTIANTVSDTTNNALLQTASDGTSLEYFDGGTGTHSITGLTVGTWYFIGISVNGTSGFAKVSADGSGSFTTVSLSGLASSTTHNFLMFGDSTFNAEFLNGRIEAAKWWSTNLSQAEVEAEKPYRAPVRTSNVRAYWFFTASKTTDNSGNGLTLTESNVVDLEGSPTNLTDNPAQGTALNAIYNPSFETDTSGWRGSGSNFSIDRSTTVGGKDGSAALRIVGGTNSTTVYNPSTDVSGSTPLGQRDIAVGTAVKVSFWLYVPAAQISNVSAVGVVGTNEGVTDAFGFQFVSPVGGGSVVADTWQQYEAVATVSSVNFRSLQIQVWTNSDVADGVVLAYIDAVSINDRLATDTYTDGSGLTDSSTRGFILSRTFDDNTALTDNIAQSEQYSRTDSTGLTDTAVISVTRNVAFTDSTGLTDNSGQVNGPAGPEVNDITGLTDTVTKSVQKNPTDDAGLDDDTAIVSTFNRSITDVVGLADGFTTATTYGRTVQDVAGLTDGATASSTFSRAASDVAGLSDQATRELRRSVDDLLGLSDDVTRVLHKTVDDSVGLRDDADDQVNYHRIVDESVGLADDPQRVATYYREANESLGLSDPIGERLWHKTRDDYLPIVDTYTAVTTFNRAASDTEGLSDSYVIVLTYSRSFTDSVGLTDNLTRQLSRLVQDDTGLTDEVELDLYRLEVIRTDSVGLTDQFTVARSRTFTKTDDTELSDEVILSMVSQRSQADNVGLADQAVVSLASSRSAADSAGLTDSFSVTLTHNRTITDSLALTDSFTAPVVFSRPITDSVGLRDYPSRPDVQFNRTFNDSAGPTDYISVTRRLTFTDSLPLADNVTQARSWSRVFTDQLGITDQLTRFASYTRSITDSVGLRDLPSVKVPTQEEWDFNFGNFKKAWNFTPTVKSWGFGDLEKAWRMTMAEQIVEVAAISAEDIEVTVSAREAGVDIDPRVDPVHFAFLTPGTSPSGGTTWVAGTWGVQDQPGDLPDLYLAIGTVSGLSAGRYDIWCRVTHGAKTPMDKVGTLIVK